MQGVRIALTFPKSEKNLVFFAPMPLVLQTTKLRPER